MSKPKNYPFVELEIAKLAKEKGFNEMCIRQWRTPNIENKTDWYFSYTLFEEESNSQYSEIACSAPYYFQLIDWFREEHGLEIEVHATSSQLDFTKGYNYWIWRPSPYIEIDSEPKNCPIGEYLSQDRYFVLQEAITKAFTLI